jgi:hypothetical protein
LSLRCALGGDIGTSALPLLSGHHEVSSASSPCDPRHYVLPHYRQQQGLLTAEQHLNQNKSFLLIG